MTYKKTIAIEEILSQAKVASQKLASIDDSTRKQALLKIAAEIERRKDEIIKANQDDLDLAQSLLKDGEITEAIIQRLKLTETKMNDIVSGIKEVASLPDPLGCVTRAYELDTKLELFRVTAPIGVVAVVFESRPDALPQIASLCLKTANVVILKGGKEADHSLQILFECINSQAIAAGIPEYAINLLNTREDFQSLLQAEEYVDLIVPRGSNALVKFIQENTRIPVLGHADGICHLYVHEDADLKMALKLAIDSKTQYPSACNAIETLLIHKSVITEFLPKVVDEYDKRNVELRLDSISYDYLKSQSTGINIVRATEDDWREEYCDLILSVKIVESLEEAVEHINKFGSGHTDCIVTQSKANYNRFFKTVDSAGVFLNASTRFADGFRYGFGAEVGIATGKLHPRGPVGLDGLVTYKYKLEGDGQIVEDYTGDNSKQFSHRPIN